MIPFRKIFPIMAVGAFLIGAAAVAFENVPYRMYPVSQGVLPWTNSLVNMDVHVYKFKDAEDPCTVIYVAFKTTTDSGVGVSIARTCDKPPIK